jgi:cell wall-associated NlpC family hydrolase
VKHPAPQGLDTRRVQQLLQIAQAGARASSRIDLISEKLIGEPYKGNPLIGSASMPEVFTASMKGFDCVTYVETVLALAQAADVPQFTEGLRQIRYFSGKIDWKRRNHYMTDWIRNNIRSGWIHRVGGWRSSVEKIRTLNVVPGLPARRAKFGCVPKAEVRKAAAQKLRTGDLVFFASTRRHLDIFHCGIVVNNTPGDQDGRDVKRVLVRHASRSRGHVVEEALADFLKRNRMAGVIAVRPSEAD